MTTYNLTTCSCAIELGSDGEPVGFAGPHCSLHSTAEAAAASNRAASAATRASGHPPGDLRIVLLADGSAQARLLAGDTLAATSPPLSKAEFVAAITGG